MFILAVATAVALFLIGLKRVEALEAKVLELTARIWELEHQAPAGGPRSTGVPATAPKPLEKPRVEAPVVAPPAVAPPVVVTPPAVPPPVVVTPVRPAQPAPPAAPLPAPATSAAATTAAAVAVHAPAASPKRTESLETRIGSRWLLYAGVIAIVVGVSYFEKLAFDNQWIGETARALQGATLGLALVAGGLRLSRTGYRVYGQVLSGCGAAILYVSTYAAFTLYHLIGQPLAFTLMFLVTVLVAWLADHGRSQKLALVAVVGGFATPFLLPVATDAHIGLFAYEAILVGGAMFLARRRGWPLLNVVSYAFLVLTISAWAAAFYQSSFYVSTELFLTIACAMYAWRISQNRDARDPLAVAERRILWTAPVGYYFASLAILSAHPQALLGYLVLLALTGVALTRSAAPWMRLVFFAVVAGPLLLWADAHAGRTWLLAGLAAWIGVYAINLVGLIDATLAADSSLSGAAIALLHANGLAAYAGAYLLLDPVRPLVLGPLAAAFALWHVLLTGTLWRRRREAALHFTALASTLLTIAVALQFERAWVTSAWAAEGAALVGLALRERRWWLRLGGLLLFAVAIARSLDQQFADPIVGQMLLFNSRAACALFIIALTYGLALAHHRLGDPATRERDTGAGLVIAKLLVLALAVSEIIAYWALHTPPPFEPIAQEAAACLIAGAVIMWLGLGRRQEWVRHIGVASVALGAYLLWTAQLDPAPAGYVAVLNGRAAAGVFAVLLLYGLIALHQRMGLHLADLPLNVAALATGASLLTLSLLTSEIDAYWTVRGAAPAWSAARDGLHAIARASVGSFIIWQGVSSRRVWIRAIGAVLLAASVWRILLLQFVDVPLPYVVVGNARVLAALVIIALLYGLARVYQAGDGFQEGSRTPRTAFFIVASALTLTLLTSEITAYWHVRDLRAIVESSAGDSHLAREMMLSVTWALYATALIVVGLRRKFAPVRYFAMVLFVVTTVKVFAIDLAELDRIYRVLSVIGLGITLLVSSYLYQRFRVGDEAT